MVDVSELARLLLAKGRGGWSGRNCITRAGDVRARRFVV